MQSSLVVENQEPHLFDSNFTYIAQNKTNDNLCSEINNMKRQSSRKNAWGCFSYADLIERAIDSNPEKRLTLNQIYAWMVENVPYFKEKSQTLSSQGWKNSIRHNLSLHRRFIKIVNQASGKSSWWAINPDYNKNLPRDLDKRKYKYQSGEKKCSVEEREVRENKSIVYSLPSYTNMQPLIMPQLSEIHVSDGSEKLDSFETLFSEYRLKHFNNLEIPQSQDDQWATKIFGASSEDKLQKIFDSETFENQINPNLMNEFRETYHNEENIES